LIIYVYDDTETGPSINENVALFNRSSTSILNVAIFVSFAYVKRNHIALKLTIKKN